MRVRKIFGPPGTGKTRQLLTLMERELQSGVSTRRVAYLTFTVEARRVATTRALKHFSRLTKRDLPYFRTLHSIAYDALGVGRTDLISSPEQLLQFTDLTGLTFTHGHTHYDPAAAGQYVASPGDHLLAFDHFRRHNLWSLHDALHAWEGDETYWELRHFTESYAAWKADEYLVDFTDLLERCDVTLPIDVMFVDEAQDLSRLQWRVLWKLAANAQRVYLAGDDDQAIFTWAGACPTAFLEQPAQETTVLSQSYRTPAAVLTVLRDLVSQIPDDARQAKHWLARGVEGDVERVMYLEQADFTKPGSYLILYRQRYQRAAVEKALREQGVAYSVEERPAPGAQWGPAIVAWERYRKGDVDKEDLNAIYDAVVPGHMPDRTQPWFVALDAISDDEAQYLRAVLQRYGNRGLTEPPSVRLSTIHKAKGAEADHVVLLLEIGRKVETHLWREPADEVRVFYVGASRAKQSLTLVGELGRLFPY